MRRRLSSAGQSYVTQRTDTYAGNAYRFVYLASFIRLVLIRDVIAAVSHRSLLCELTQRSFMPSQHANLFLNALSSISRDSLLRHCVEVDLPLKKSLYEPDNVPRYAYFITSGIASVVTSMEDGATAEVGLIGREGVVGSFHLLGPAKCLPAVFPN